MDRRNLRLLYLLALIRLVLPYLLQHPYYQPHRDEFLYLAEGHHLAWGYLEVPPLLSLFAWLTNLLGGGMFWIKLWPDLFGSLTFLLAGRTILVLGGGRFALLLGWLPFVLDGYLRLFFLFQPNFLDVFFWTAMAYCLVCYVRSGSASWIYGFGLALGLGMMSKYSVAFYGISLLAGLLLTRERSVFGTRTIYLAGLIALLVFLPNLIWQYNHRFPVIHHMSELQQEQLQYNDATGFLVSQLVMNLPCVFIWISGLLWVWLGREGRPYRFLGWSYLLVIALLIALRGKDYYALGVYPMLFAFGAWRIEQATRQGRRWLRYALLVFAVGLGLFGMPLTMPVLRPQGLIRYYQATGLDHTGGFKWEDQQYHPLPQDFADMIGWREMARKAGAVYRSLPDSERRKTLVFCRGYFTAGALNYYREEAGLPEVYSDNASFLLWLPDSIGVRNLLLVAHQPADPEDPAFRHFARYTVRDSVAMPLFREHGMKFILYEKADDSSAGVFHQAVRTLKSRYSR
ncbi:MAG TPA: glycosyltransferase family 39 protein [Chitinophagaceae bacterium]|nr:glycosyltransferase family 39 protein [Chitinophagaceae bacterium]